MGASPLLRAVFILYDAHSTLLAVFVACRWLPARTSRNDWRPSISACMRTLRF